MSFKEPVNPSDKRCPRCRKLNKQYATSCWTCSYTFPPTNNESTGKKFLNVLFALGFLAIAVNLGIPFILSLLCMAMK